MAGQGIIPQQEIIEKGRITGKDSRISICGDVCSECPRYIATSTNDIEGLRKLAELWHRLGFRDKIVDPDELRCTGCDKKKYCSYSINTCEHLNGKNNCGECDRFPCDKINLVFAKTDNINETCKNKCSGEEYRVLYRAFLMKRQVLANINADLKRSNQA